MVWEQRCATIVMMTKLEERSRIKCDQYWPGRGAETYGLMHVLLVDVAELATYTIRTFHIQRVSTFLHRTFTNIMYAEMKYENNKWCI